MRYFRNKLDLTLIVYELKCEEHNENWGYPCRGYPSADKLVPAFERIGAKIQVIEFKNYANVNLTPDKDKQDIFKNLKPVIKSNKVLIEWDGITSKRDYKAIFDWGKKIYIIPHHEGRISGYGSSPEVEREFRRYLTQKSTKIIFELQSLRDLWHEFECKKYELFYSPTRTGVKYDKMEARKTLGIKTKYAIIAWGQYTGGKHYADILPWLAEWKDTSLLFCGSGEAPEKKLIIQTAQNLGVYNKIFFSQHGISDVDSDIWFCASDLCTSPRTYFGTSTPAYIAGQGKVFILPDANYEYWEGYRELEKISGVVVSNDIKATTRDLLLNEDKRKILEAKSIKYAEENSFDNYAKKIIELMK